LWAVVVGETPRLSQESEVSLQHNKMSEKITKMHQGRNRPNPFQEPQSTTLNRDDVSLQPTVANSFKYNVFTVAVHAIGPLNLLGVEM
jgi:hypothetical protein